MSRQRRLRVRTGLVALVASAALLAPQIAQASPSEADIARAQAEEQAAKMSVAQIEVRLASVSAQADAAMQAAQAAAEELNAANMKLDEAKSTATQAQKDADKARADFEEGKKEIASVAQTAYREGAASLDSLAPYLGSDGLRTVETKQASISTFSNSADAKMQRVTALEQVATVMQKAADEAVAAQTTAAQEVETRTDAAKASAQSALALQQTTAAQKEAYVAELAKKQNTTVELIQQREAAIEAARQAAAEAAAKAAAEAAAREAQRRAAEEAAAEAAEAAAAEQASRSETREEATPAPAPAPAPSAPESSGGASTAISAAKSFLGVPYVWAGESYGGVDCSGLVMLAWAQAGVSLSHSSRAQYWEGTQVPLGAVEPGDLVFWSSNGTPGGIYHVAMYLGGDTMIEAPVPGLTVRITGMRYYGGIMPYAVRL